MFPVYSTQNQEEIFIYDEFVVRFKSTVSSKEIEVFSSRHEVEIVKINDYEPTQYTFRWTPGADGNPLIMSNMFFDSLDCEWATPDFVIQGSTFDVIPNDLYFPNQYYLHNTGQEPIPGEGPGVPDTDIDAPEAWEISLGNSNIKVAVIDEGVMPHPDLPASRILPGYDYSGLDNDPSPDGNQAHGMAVAGIIAASHNSIGIAGIAPNCKILPVKIFDFLGTLAPVSKVANAVDFAWGQGGADVINGSWGYPTTDPNDPLYTQIRDAVVRAMAQGRNNLGTVCVFAAGNNGGGGNFVQFPANIPGVITVGAIDKNNNKQSYSPQGTALDVVAPSGAIASSFLSTINLLGNVWSIEVPGQIGLNPGDYNIGPPFNWIDYSGTPSPKGDNYPPGNYTARFGGTSAAAPQVAGVAALILSQNPNLTQSEVVTRIKNSAVHIGLPEVDQGSGRLNAYNALTYNTTPPAQPQNLQLSIVSYHPHLTWNQNSEPDLAGYYIYRTENSNPVEQIAYVPKNAQRQGYTDTEVSTVVQPDNISYTIKAKNISGPLSVASDPVSVMGILMKPNPETELKKLQYNYSLNQNYPNPFNPSTEISYSLKEDGIVVIKVFDVLGREVAVLKNKYETAGNHIVNFNAVNLPSGIYFYRIVSGSFHQTKKLVLMK